MPELGGTIARWNEPRLKIRGGISVASCACCDTDYEIDIKKGNKGGEWKMRLTTYHKLGSFRTPDDDAWMGLTSSNRDDKLLRYRKENVSGKVRRDWLEDQKKTSIAAEHGGPGDLTTTEHAGQDPIEYWACSPPYQWL